MKFLESPKHLKKYDLMFEDNLVKDFLKARGYKYIHFGSTSFTFHNRYADENINMSMLSPYQLFIWRRTLLYPLLTFATRNINYKFFEEFFDELGGLDQRQMTWERTYFQLNKLGEISHDYEEPVFIFAHFSLPKGSSIFDPQGNLMTEKESLEKTQAEIYIDQMAFINGEMTKLITKLIDNSELDPIIIIQGDHGYQFFTDNEFNDPTILAEIIPESVAVKELLVSENVYSFPIFNAYYFPDNNNEVLYDTISPVNTFRVIFNTYFQQNLELYDDISYIQDPNDDSQFIPLDL